MGVNMSENADVKLLFEYFKEMRSEINIRIKNHTSLLTAKVVTSGGLLAFMLTEKVKDLPEVKTLGFLVVPLVAFLFDVMIAKNIRNIHTIGLFIHDQIEFGFRQKDILHDKLKMWEEYAGQRNTWTRCYGIVDVIILSLFTAGTAGIALYVLFKNNSPFFCLATWGLCLTFVAVLVYMIANIAILKPETKERNKANK